MRFIEYLTEAEGEFLPKDKSTAGRLAADMLSGANGDPAVAKQMAQSFLQQLMSAIDAQGFQSRREQRKQAGAKYTQQSGRGNRGFSRYA